MLDLARAYRTLDDVVDGLGVLGQHMLEAGDRRSIFVTLYSVVSAAMRDKVAGGLFEDNEWVRRYTVAFANLYRVALAQYEAGRLQDVPKAWRLGFEHARAGQGLVLQDLLLGVNAHINHDLPLALTTVSIDPGRASRHRDHTAVNQVLGAVTDRATEALAALYAPGLRTMDDVAGQVDELVGAFSLEAAREAAWESGIALADTQGTTRSVVMRLISARAAAVARLLGAPSRSPTFVRACRVLERDPDWLALVTRRICGVPIARSAPAPAGRRAAPSFSRPARKRGVRRNARRTH